ncbi:hypothetical protein [Streptomyces albogriseolus]|uniref:hypothetical protein n=1 Tax=Streptomyces albogriseolus TaxID=1887 RepID=UPI0037FDE46A
MYQFVSELPYRVGELTGCRHDSLRSSDGDVRSALADVRLKGLELGEEILLASPVQ